ncbi:hypothetical protein PM082_013889 [Marasmius tenuissimus]|nr:hypothetical protein PM082_013889 [Marasmius tenuissimus]
MPLPPRYRRRNAVKLPAIPPQVQGGVIDGNLAIWPVIGLLSMLACVAVVVLSTRYYLKTLI